MKYTIAADFQKLFRPLSADELKQAEANNLFDPTHERVPPVVLWANHENTVIDGHHTLAIRERNLLKVRFAKVEFESRDEAMAYAIRCQLGRRNLDASQIAIALAKLPKAKPGGDRKSDQSANLPIDRETLAEEHGVSPRTLTSADKVQEHGAAAVVQAVQEGTVAVSDAAAIVDLPKSEQTAALAKVKAGKARTLRAAAPKAKPKPKAGKVKFDYKNFESVFGKLVRLIDDHHRVHPDPTMRDACHESLNTMLADFKAWRKKVKA